MCELATAQEETERVAENRPFATYFVEDFTLYIDAAMVQIQKQAYEGGLAALKDEPRPFTSLAGAKALVESYVRLGLPQAVSGDPLLQSDVEGTGAQFLDPAPGIPRPVTSELADLLGSFANERVEQYEGSAIAASLIYEPQDQLLIAAAEWEKDLKKDLIAEEVPKRTTAWANQVAERVKPYIEDKLSGYSTAGTEEVGEQSPLLESTVNRVRLTRDVLKESKAPTAETIAPSGVGATEATLNGEVDNFGEEIETGGCRFEYGSSVAYGHTVPCTAIPAPSNESSLVSGKVTGWTPNGSFHERLVVTTWGGTTYGEDVKVQLGAGSGGSAPTVVTGAATRINRRTALLHGTVNPNGSAVVKCWATIQEAVGKKETLSFPASAGSGRASLPGKCS